MHNDHHLTSVQYYLVTIIITVILKTVQFMWHPTSNLYFKQLFVIVRNVLLSICMLDKLSRIIIIISSFFCPFQIIKKNGKCGHYNRLHKSLENCKCHCATTDDHIIKVNLRGERYKRHIEPHMFIFKTMTVDGFVWLRINIIRAKVIAYLCKNIRSPHMHTSET